MDAEEQRGKKRSKAQYVGNAKRQRRSRNLEVGMQGILITCNMNMAKCVGEAYSLLNEYGEKLYGAEKLCDKEDQASDSEEDEDDVEAALKKEVDQIRSSTEKNQRRFQSHQSGANNVVFIRTQNVDPEKLVHHILEDLYATKKKKSRVILRMLPVTGTCKAYYEDLKKYAETFMQPWFKAPNKGTFQIVYKSRNNNSMSRDQVIKDVAGVVGSLNPENKVDLTNPEYTIVVEIIKNVCCLSVVRDYNLFRKYNLQEVVKATNEDGQTKPLNEDKGKALEEKVEAKDKPLEVEEAKDKPLEEEEAKDKPLEEKKEDQGKTQDEKLEDAEKALEETVEDKGNTPEKKEEEPASVNDI